MLRKILVPLDGSSLAEAVLPVVARLSASFGGQVTLLSVVASLQGRRAGKGSGNGQEPPAAAGPASVRAEYVKGIAHGLAGEGIRARSQVIAGEPSQCIVDFAHRNAYDLIAISTHGRTGITRWVYGSVADWVMHNTATPLLLVRPSKKGASDPGGPLRRVVVPLDGSAAAETALDYAAPIAQAMGLALHLVRVVKPRFSISDELSMGYYGRAGDAGMEAADIMEQDRGNAQEYLAGVRALLLGPEVPATVLTAVGDPASVITEMAGETSGVLVVMTSHARRGVARAIFGSVAESVVRSSRSPTLVLRPLLVERAREERPSTAFAGPV